MGGLSNVVVLVVMALTVVFAQPAKADESSGWYANYVGQMATTAGYRTVNIDGSKDKYREDYDLRSGGRLFNYTIDGSSSAPDVTSVDRFHLEVDTPGDEPVSRFRLSAADSKRFDLRAAFTRSRYEYSVPQLFEAPVTGNARTDDLHDFDFDRTNGSVDLTVRARGLPRLRFGYRLYRRDGDGISTVRIPGGDTFLVRGPIDTLTHVGLVGADFRALETDVSLQQEYRRVDRTQTLRDLIEPAGLDPTDGSTISSYRSDQGQHIDIPATTLRLRRAIGDGVDLTAAYFFSRATLGLDYGRDRRGTSNASGFGGTANATGNGDSTLTTHVVDLAASVRVSDHVRIHGAYRFNERSQKGSFDEVGSFGLLSASTEDNVSSNQLSAEVEVEPAKNLLLRGGMRYARRQVDISAGAKKQTDTVGAIGSVRYRPRSYVDLFARYENVQTFDPFVVPGDATNVPELQDREIVLTFTNRAAAGIRLRPWRRVRLNYRFVADSRKNDSFNGRSRSFGNTVEVTVIPVSGLTILANYTRRDFDRRADIFLAPLYSRSSSVQDGAEDAFVGVLRYRFKLFGERWSSGANVSFVGADSTLRPRLERDGLTKSSFDLDRIDGGAFLTLYRRLFDTTVEVRVVDYNQSPLARNDYRATMVLLKATRRLGF